MVVFSAVVFEPIAQGRSGSGAHPTSSERIGLAIATFIGWLVFTREARVRRAWRADLQLHAQPPSGVGRRPPPRTCALRCDVEGGSESEPRRFTSLPAADRRLGGAGVLRQPGGHLETIDRRLPRTRDSRLGCLTRNGTRQHPQESPTRRIDNDVLVARSDRVVAIAGAIGNGLPTSTATSRSSRSFQRAECTANRKRIVARAWIHSAIAAGAGTA